MIDKSLLDFDPLNRAEEITAKSYKDDETTSSLGFLFHVKHNQIKRQKLREANDSYFGQEAKFFIDLLVDLGFTQLLNERFKDNDSDHSDTFYIFYHPDNLLIKFDTYYDNTVNGGTCYLNWTPNDYDVFLKNIILK